MWACLGMCFLGCVVRWTLQNLDMDSSVHSVFSDTCNLDLGVLCLGSFVLFYISCTMMYGFDFGKLEFKTRRALACW